MRIGIDVDGVLADFNVAYINRTIQLSQRDLFPARPFDIPCWHYPEHYGYTKDEVSAVWESITADGLFWAALPAYPTTAKFMTAIAATQRLPWHDVYFITARPGDTAKSQTERWLAPFLETRLHYTFPTVLIASDKAAVCKALNLDVYLDDRWENALSVAETQTQAYLLDRPWNQTHRNTDGELGNGYVRVASVMDFLPCIAPSYSRSA